MNFLSRVFDNARLFLRYPQTILCIITERRFSFMEVIIGFTFGHAVITLQLPQVLLVGVDRRGAAHPGRDTASAHAS